MTKALEWIVALVVLLGLAALIFIGSGQRSGYGPVRSAVGARGPERIEQVGARLGPHGLALWLAHRSWSAAARPPGQR